MKNIAYNLIIEYINEHNLDGFARAYIQGVNDMLEAITTAESTTESTTAESTTAESTESTESASEPEPEPESRCIDVDAGESEDGPEYDEPTTTEYVEPKSVTTVTKQGVKVRTSNVDIGHLVSLRSKGMTYKQIGDRLGIAPSTVCTLYKKYLSQFD